jgi:hypothetical protein
MLSNRRWLREPAYAGLETAFCVDGEVVSLQEHGHIDYESDLLDLFDFV